MPICTGIKTNGTPCSFKTRPGMTTCGHHAHQETHLPPPAAPVQAAPVQAAHVRCEFLYGVGRCAANAVDGHHCQKHINRLAIRANQAAQRQRGEARQAQLRADAEAHNARIFARVAANHQRAALLVLEARAARIPLEEAIDQWILAENNGEINRAVLTRAAMDYAEVFGQTRAVGYHYVAERLRGQEAGAARAPAIPAARPVAAPTPQLGRLAADRQNVHTVVVTKQTNAGLDIILATPVPSRQRTLEEIMAAWLLSRYDAASVVSTYEDMRAWYAAKTCRAPNDCLYKRALDGLWAMIKSRPDEMRNELTYRLYEEARDSIKMCCDGHMSRLCNVMSGFDGAFKPQVSKGESLQQRMADIAAMDITESDKKRLATRVCDELSVPQAERSAWIDAL